MSKHFVEVFKRDSCRCVYCGRNLPADFHTWMTAEEDHLVPRGATHPDNLVIACSACNRLRGAFTPRDLQLTPATRGAYVRAIREEIMRCRARKTREFISWTHPNSEYHEK